MGVRGYFTTYLFPQRHCGLVAQLTVAGGDSEGAGELEGQEGTRTIVFTEKTTAA